MKNNTNTQNTETALEVTFAEMNVNEDLKHSILIVSIIANLFVLTTWIALQVTTQYDTQIANFLFTR
ncbi:MAG TPA: hypothetical protein VGO98_01420 [Candidatus Saccharimonadales bacterium]|jgi:hypothetical protein|nr:hypothetical protein [Candidatus Saccharimonadales bacterium]